MARKSLTDKVEAAKSAINAVFSDMSVSRSECRENLRDLQEEIEVLLDALETDDKQD